VTSIVAQSGRLCVVQRSRSRNVLVLLLLYSSGQRSAAAAGEPHYSFPSL
jgi:hypothetical protein